MWDATAVRMITVVNIIAIIQQAFLLRMREWANDDMTIAGVIHILLSEAIST